MHNDKLTLTTMETYKSLELCIIFSPFSLFSQVLLRLVVLIRSLLARHSFFGPLSTVIRTLQSQCGETWRMKEVGREQTGILRQILIVLKRMLIAAKSRLNQVLSRPKMTILVLLSVLNVRRGRISPSPRSPSQVVPLLGNESSKRF